MRRNEGPARTGFTLVELVVVVLITGILAAVAAPRFTAALSRYRVEAVAEKLVADLALARRHGSSVSQNQEVRFFTSPGDGYRCPGMSQPGHASADFEVLLTDVSDGISGLVANFDGEVNLTFDVYGRPFAGSPLAPLTSGSVVVSSGGLSRTVVVNPVTGEASVQ